MEAAAAVVGVSAAAAAAEQAPLKCVFCLDDLSSHPEARLQPRDPNGWGATRSALLQEPLPLITCPPPAALGFAKVGTCLTSTQS